MAEPIININIKLKRIGSKGLKDYKLSEIEKLHIQNFVGQFCNETIKYLNQKKIQGEVKNNIDYGK